MWPFTPKDWRDAYRQMPDSDLLNRIHNGDQLAEEYLWETYSGVVATHMAFELRKYGKPEQLGSPVDFAHDAVLFLIDKARLAGSAALKDGSNIKNWLKKTATNFMRNAIRKDNRNERDEPTGNDDTDEQSRSKVDSIEDEGADSFADLPEKSRDEIIRQVLATLPEKVSTLIRFKFMDGFSWKETAELMLRLFPDNDPPFELAYLQKTYWDRTHKKPFIKKLGDDFNDQGYDF